MTPIIRMLAGAAALLAVAAITARSAVAVTTAQPCCACVELSGDVQPIIPAFFCGFFPGAEQAAAAARCEALNVTADPGLICVGASASNCTKALAARDIGCPPSAGAPAASSTVLSALVALLGAAGYVTVRRRARAPRA